MATGSILLLPGSATPPDNSASNAAPALSVVQSTAANPKPHFLVADFDPATDEHLFWTFRMPANYASGLTAKIQGIANATSGSARLGVRIGAVTPADTDTPIEHALASANTGAWAANGTEANRLVELSITLSTADSLAAGDLVMVCFFRDADGTSGTDDLAVDFRLLALTLEYTTT